MITTNDLILYFEEILSNLKDDTLSDDLKFQLTLIYIRDKYNIKEENKYLKKEAIILLSYHAKNKTFSAEEAFSA